MVLEPLPSDLKELVLQNFHNVITGFCWEEKALKIAEIIWTLKPRWSVEIGVYGGKSFIPIGTVISYIDKNQGLHRALGVDVWEANAAADCYENTPHDVFWRNQKLLDKVRNEAFQHVNNLQTLSVQLYIGTSEQASKCFQQNEISFCHIDGNHSEQHVYRDISNWWSKIHTNGVIVLDDIGWIPDGAVEWVARRSKEICKLNGSVFFQKKTD